jgi:hypothetical protein
MSKTLPKYLHSYALKTLNKDFVEQTEEYIVDGEKGILIKYFHVEKNIKKKISIKGNKDGSFSVKTEIGGKKDEKTMSKDDIVKMVKGDNELKFVSEFLKTQKGGAWLNRTKSGSKKSSKKGSKKSSKKH